MTDNNNTDNDKTERIELTERQRERLDRIKAECAGDVPEPTDVQIMKSLMDTWDAVGDGVYEEMAGRDWDYNEP